MKIKMLYFWVTLILTSYIMNHTFKPENFFTNTFTGTVDEPSKSGNLMCSISDHLAQFLIYPKQNTKKCLNEKTKYNRNYKKLIETNLSRI